ncbi:hypothetical protein AX17_000853 [Amanita inopinata Kibby_2008]|nr:hypothetical protein AX17_000853 [Amanita inopinata Kibby_2008]
MFIYTPYLPEILAKDSRSIDEPKQTLVKNKVSSQPFAKLAVIGSAAVDITAKPTRDANNADLATNSTVPGNVSLTLGGVARNITEAAHRVMTSSSSPLSPPLLIAPIGNDSFGALLTAEMKALGMRTDGLLESVEKHKTAVCNMVLDGKGDLVGGVADMRITESFSTEQVILSTIHKNKPEIVALDGNLTSSALTAVVELCVSEGINCNVLVSVPPLVRLPWTDPCHASEPTSVIKSTSILPAIASCLDIQPGFAPITFASPNLLELAHMYQAARSEPHDLMSHSNWWSAIDSFALGPGYRMDLGQLANRRVCDEDHSKGTLAFLIDEGVAQMAINLLPFFQHLVIKCGEQGVLAAMHLSGMQSTSMWYRKRSNALKRYIIARGNSGNLVVLQHFPAHSLNDVANVTGAGDSFVGALLSFIVQNRRLFHDQRTLADAVIASQQAAVLTLQSHLAVSPLISYQRITELS